MAPGVADGTELFSPDCDGRFRPETRKTSIELVRNFHAEALKFLANMIKNAFEGICRIRKIRAKIF